MRLPEPPLAGMSFAESQLRRHGWRRGQGLGKREDGIAEAIRVKVKCDTAGVGHDAAEPFSFHWWDHLFNKAAANISVEDGQDGISMKTLAEEGLRISSKKPRKAASAGSMLYGRFVKSATLTASGEEPTRLPSGSESSEEEEEKLDLSSARRLTDEELMRACGGRTAHKGARHGLTMSAKLARLEEQERAFLAEYRREGRQQECPRSSLAAGSQGKEGRKRKQSRDGADPEGLQSQEPSGEEEEAGEEEKVMKKKRRRKNQEPSGEEEVTGEEGKVMKRKRRRKNQEPSGEEEVTEEEGKDVKRKKRKDQEPSGEEEVAEEEGKDVKRKKRKDQEPSGGEEVAGEEGKVVKRKRRKNQEPSGGEEVAGEEGKDVKRKKKRKDQDSSGKEEGKVMKRKKQQEGNEELAEAKKKKKKKRKKQEEDKEPAETELHLEDTDGPDQAGHSPRKKKKKKRKRKPE